MTGLLLAWSGVVGLAVGSFLNVVVARVPAGRSVVRPASACPHCDTPIASRDNIPVLSWLLLRGRCRHCRAPISVRYPAIELATGVLFVAVVGVHGFTLTSAAVAAFAAGLVALAAVDLERLLLPKRIVYPTAVISAAFLLAAAADSGHWVRLGGAAACGAAAFALFFVLNLVNPRWMGFGDVRLAGVVGLVLGWLGPTDLVVGLLAANVLGLVVASVGLALGRMSRSTPMPYGVFLAAGSLVAVLAGTPLSGWLAGR